MTRLVVRLLGDLQVGRGASGPAVPIPARKVRALLAYLALHPGHPHPRDRLTALLWPDVADAQARQSLRQALAGLRRALAKRGGLVADADKVAVDPLRVDVDVTRFEELIADGSRSRLEQAVALYRGDFLEGFQVKAPVFEDWLLTERERLRELARKALTKLLANQTRTGTGEVALHTARRLLALDPLREDVQRALMRLYVAQGQSAAALRQYQSCVGVLRRELGVEPEAATKRLYQEILQRPLLPGVMAGPPPPPVPAERRSPTRSQPGRVHGELALIGRDAEIARLRRARDEAWDGRARVVLVTGEAGIGKTRLLEQVAVEAAERGGRVLAGRFHETEQILPFQAWIDALRRGDVLGGLGDLGAWRAELTRLFPELGPPPGVAASPVRLLEAMLAVVDRLAARHRLLVVLDDLHWADEMSVRLFSFIGRRIRRRPVLLVGSAREEDLTEARPLRQALEELDREECLVRLALSPLSQVHTVELVRMLLRRGTAETSVERVGDEIWRTSEGNPFVIVEALRELVEGGRAADAGPVRVPRRVRDLLSARLERLGEPSRRLAAVAAVIGRDFSFTLLQRSGGLAPPETAEGLEELVRRRIVSAVGEAFDFTHDRIRRVVYNELLEPRRRMLHAVVGEALEALYADRPAEVYDRLAHHYVQAGVAEKAVIYLARFGDLARRRYAHTDALRAFDQALAMVEKLAVGECERRRIQIVVDKAAVLSVLARFQETIELLAVHRAQLEALGDPTLAGPFFFRLGLTHAFLSHRDEALEAIQRSRDEAERAGDDGVAGQAHYALMLVSYWWDTPAEGIIHGDRAVPLLEKAGRQDWLGLTHAIRAVCHHTVGNFEQALADAGLGEAIGASLDEPRIQSNAAAIAALVHAVRGDREAALACAQRAIDAARDPYAAAVAHAYLGIVALEHGEVAKAIPALANAVAGLRGFGNLAPAARIQSYLAEAHRRAGDPDQARGLAVEVLALSRMLDTRTAGALAERALGRIAIDQGAVGEAETRLAAALEVFSSVPVPFEAARTHLDLVETAHWRDDAVSATAHLEQAAGGFARLRLPTWFARTTELARQLGLAPIAAAAPSAHRLPDAEAPRPSPRHGDGAASRDDGALGQIRRWKG
jgi:DNA-binding SARP family transcriptional activator